MKGKMLKTNNFQTHLCVYTIWTNENAFILHFFFFSSASHLIRLFVQTAAQNCLNIVNKE